MNSSNLLTSFLVILFSSIVVARSMGDVEKVALFPTVLPDPTQPPQGAGSSGAGSPGAGSGGSDSTNTTTVGPTTRDPNLLPDGRHKRRHCESRQFDSEGFCIGYAWCQSWEQIPYLDYRGLMQKTTWKKQIEGTKYYLGDKLIFTYEHGGLWKDKCIAHIIIDGWVEDAVIRCSSIGKSDVNMKKQYYDDECQSQLFSWEKFYSYYGKPASYKRFV